MSAKDSVKKRLEGENGMSFTEFTYQLVQGYDFYWLYTNKNCKLQMGGSDQWGNITTGTELIRRKTGGAGEAFAFTCPLLTKADGGKFGKTEKGNIWLDPEKTSPYQFYQFWLNAADIDAEKWIKIFTFLTQAEIAHLLEQHKGNEHARQLQKKLAEEVTQFVHGAEALKKAKDASDFLFSPNATGEILRTSDHKTFLSIFESVPIHHIAKDKMTSPLNIVDFLVDTKILSSKGEARKLVENGGISINKEKVPAINHAVRLDDIVQKEYLVVQKGKKNYYLVKVL